MVEIIPAIPNSTDKIAANVPAPGPVKSIIPYKVPRNAITAKIKKYHL